MHTTGDWHSFLLLALQSKFVIWVQQKKGPHQKLTTPISPLGQLSSEEISLYIIILHHVRGSTTLNLDHLQIQPINGWPFLTAKVIIPCLKMVSLKNTVRATVFEGNCER